MRYPKLRELKEAIRALIRGPYTVRYPYVKHEPFERFRGKPEFHAEDCVGCGACSQVCPAGAIEMFDCKDKRVLKINLDLCIFCGQCQANCLTGKGIILSRQFDLATTDRKELKQQIEKELVFCDCCKEAVAARDQILWVADKLGPLTFSNSSLMLFYLQNSSLAAGQGNCVDSKEASRSDRIRILCPRCRREAVVKS